jgi:hypothetical protein
MNEDVEKHNKEYEYVKNTTIVFDIVKENIADKGTSSVTTVSGKKIWFDGACNDNYYPSFLDNFIQIGDTIIKNSGSDTLFIHRNKKEFYFVLNKNVEKSK